MQKQGSDSTGVILGVGNILQRDDGIGVKMLKFLEAAYIFPDSVRLIDGGTAGSAIQNEIMNIDWLIIIDALASKGEPGSVHFITEKELAGRISETKLSPHQMNFFDLLQFLKLEGSGPDEMNIIGIIPENMDLGTEISASVEKGMNEALSILLNWLKENQGIIPIQNNDAKPNYWWIK